MLLCYLLIINDLQNGLFCILKQTVSLSKTVRFRSRNGPFCISILTTENSTVRETENSALLK